MVLNGEEKIKLLAYFIVIFTFSISLSFPLIFRYVGTYAAPPSVYAIKILDSGSLTNSVYELTNGYWKTSTMVETDFPLPSVLISIIILVSGVPKEYALFLPIVGLASIIYFILARKVLCTRQNTETYGLLFSALFYAFLTFNHLSGGYCGRATLGEAFLALFIFSCILFFSQCLRGRPQRSMVALLILVAVAIGYTYYVSIVSVIVFTIGMIVSTSFAAFFIPSLSKPKGLLIRRSTIWLTSLVIGTLCLICNPFFTNFARTINFGSFMNNMIQYAKIALRIETQSPQALLYSRLGEVDSLTTILGQITLTIKYASIIAIPVGLFIYRPRLKKHTIIHKITFFFLLIAFFCSLAEFSYLLYGSFYPFRHAEKYGLIALLFLIEGLIVRSKTPTRVFLRRARKLHILSMPWKRLRFNKKKLVAMFTVLIVSFGCWGSFRVAWYYGIAKPSSFHNVTPVSEFLLTCSSNENPMILTGDVYYTAYIFFRVSLYSNNNVAPEPLDKDAIALYHLLKTGEVEYFLVRMQERNTKYLLIVEDGKPISGSAWGFQIIPPKSSALQEQAFSIIYTDGRAKLFRINK